MTENMEDSSSSGDETIVDEDDLSKFTLALDQFTPAIPETVTKFYMRQSGLQADDDRVVKLMSMSVQKFMTDVINDCYQLHKIREKSTNRQVATASVSAVNAQPATTEVAAATTTDAAVIAASAKKPVSSTNQTLTLNDLTHVLGEYGINVKKTFYYT